MSIITFDGQNGYLAAKKQKVGWLKTGSKTLVGGAPYTVFDVAGDPGAGTLAIGNTANGVVPTDATTGYPTIRAFPTAGHYGYLSRVYFGSSVAGIFDVYDRVFAAGAYAYNADTTLASQPDYSGRVPDGDYNGLELWVEAATVFTGTPSVQVNYLDQDGNAGDTGAISLVATMPACRCYRLPLASGDYGVRQITRVRGSAASAGTFNVMVLRPLWRGKVFAANAGDVHDLFNTGMPRVYEDSALYVLLTADSTAVGLPVIEMQIAMG
jgi:hypothetical protein